MKQRPRYQIDRQRNVVIDADTNAVVCSGTEVQQYFDQFGSSVRAHTADIDQQIQALASQRTALQKTCSHVYATYEPRANTGNWCAADDQYWYDLHCYECGLHWRQPQ
jgi:hypothetical protein